jgi:hypothetical protein
MTDALDRLKAALADRYSSERELGSRRVATSRNPSDGGRMRLAKKGIGFGSIAVALSHWKDPADGGAVAAYRARHQ